MFNFSNLTAEEFSAMSGRICAPGIPPKSKEEAKEHIAMIRKLLDHERQLAAEEARESRERRETRERCLRHWEDVVMQSADFDEAVQSKVTTQLWAKHGLPMEVRGDVWCRSIGNAQGISSKLYHLCVTKSIARERSLATSVSAASNSNSHSPSPQTSCTAPDAASHHARLVSVRERREEDPTFFSPQMSKFESMLLINVDLPRTVITRGLSSPAPSASSSCTSPVSGSPLQSPRGRSSFFSNNSDAGMGADATPVLSTAAMAAPPLSQSSTCSIAGNDERVEATEGGGVGLSAGLAHAPMLISSMCDETLMLRVRRALCAYVEFRPDIGYLQGMSYVAAMILLHVPSDEAGFIALANLLSKGHFKYFFSVHHQGIGAYMAAFDDVFRRSLPQLHDHFTRIGVHPQMYLMDWWMALFSRALPYDVVVRCWDLYLLDEVYLFRLSLAILVYFAAQVHEDSALDEVMVFLTKLQRQSVDEYRFFAIVDDDASFNGCTLPVMREVLVTWQKELVGLERPLEL